MGHAAEQDQEHVKTARETWFESQLDLDPDRLVFIDETAATTAMALCYRRAPRSERRRMSVPQGRRALAGYRRRKPSPSQQASAPAALPPTGCLTAP